MIQPPPPINVPVLRRMSCNAVAFLYDCECEWRRSGRHSIILIEPLNTDAPADARPYCYGINDVDFYDATGNKKLAKATTHTQRHASPTLMRVRGTGRWWELGTGSVRRINCRWCMVWDGWDNTRAASDLNGEPDGDLGIRPRLSVSLAWWAVYAPGRLWWRVKTWARTVRGVLGRKVEVR